MDELDKLKNIWDQSTTVPHKGYTPDEIRQIIQRKSDQPIDKLKRSLKVEIGVTILMIPLLIFVAFRLPQIEYIIYSSLLGVLSIAAIWYYFKNLKKLNKRWRDSNFDLKSTIEDTLTQFRFFKRVYFKVNLLLLPLGMYLGFMLGYAWDKDEINPQSIVPLGDLSVFHSVLVLIPLFAAGIAFGVWFLHIYIKYLYGKHIIRLESILSELNENLESE